MQWRAAEVGNRAHNRTMITPAQKPKPHKTRKWGPVARGARRPEPQRQWAVGPMSSTTPGNKRSHRVQGRHEGQGQRSTGHFLHLFWFEVGQPLPRPGEVLPKGVVSSVGSAGSRHRHAAGWVASRGSQGLKIASSTVNYYKVVALRGWAELRSLMLSVEPRNRSK